MSADSSQTTATATTTPPSTDARLTSDEFAFNYADKGPFASRWHVLERSGKRRIDVRPSDRDVLAMLNDADTIRLLHLENVRDDTKDQALRAIDAWLDALPAAGTQLDPETFIEHNADPVHADVRAYLEEEATRRGFVGDSITCTWEDARGGYPRDALRRGCNQPSYEVEFTDAGVGSSAGSRSAWVPPALRRTVPDHQHQ